ncbi:MAG: outer membrane protein assembly factor BamE [Alphaproteobacteria bacterium]|nr:outer membrane protein assembly factor BamE [Alphaproteobacteria bacterium]
MTLPPFPAFSARHVPTRLLVLAMVAVLGCGCSWFGSREQVRGNMVDADALKQLVPGTSTRADVTAAIGSPTMKASFNDNRWIYIGEVTQNRIASKPAVVAQRVVVLSFDDQGVLRDIQRLTKRDSLPVDVVGRTTPSPGAHASLFQQLFGNVGRVGPGLGSNTGPTGATLNSGAP